MYACKWRYGALCVSAAMGTASAQGQSSTPSFTQPRSKVSTVPDLQRGVDTAPGTKAKLKLVQVVFRHGARTPLTNKSYLWKGHKWDCCNGTTNQPIAESVRSLDGGKRPDNPGDTEQIATKLEGGCHKGQLTEVGHQQARALGSWLRKRYVDELGFLPPDAQSDGLYARTTNYQRTIATLQGVLTGIYPDSRAGIQMFTTSHDDEILFADIKGCPRLLELMKSSKAIFENKCVSDADRTKLLNQLQDVLELDKEALKESKWFFTDIHDVMTSLAAHEKPLPPKMSSELLAVVEKLAVEEFSTFVAPPKHTPVGKEMLQLGAGRMLWELMSNMEERIARSDDSSSETAPIKPIMYLYSGHDSTILPLLAALGVELDHWPPYLASIVFELWEVPKQSCSEDGSDDEKSKQQLVRLLYNEAPLLVPEVTNAEDGIQYDNFKDSILGPLSMSPEERALVCGLPDPEHDDKTTGGVSSPSDISKL